MINTLEAKHKVVEVMHLKCYSTVHNIIKDSGVCPYWSDVVGLQLYGVPPMQLPLWPCLPSLILVILQPCTPLVKQTCIICPKLNVAMREIEFCLLFCTHIVLQLHVACTDNKSIPTSFFSMHTSWWWLSAYPLNSIGILLVVNTFKGLDQIFKSSLTTFILLLPQ